MSTFLCKNGVRKEYFLTPTFIIEPKKDPAGKGILSLRSLRITLAELGPSRNMGIKHEKVQFAFFPFIMFGA